ncbi:MAG TPA: hypothetical protein VL403_18535 [Candidatus Kryptonia bacterium]|nr:hypothetical protein [Candidatus Kryptonia bacterium]
MQESPTLNRTPRRCARLTGALYALVVLYATATPALAAPTLDELMADFAFSKEDVQKVRNGELVNTAAAATSDRELAVVMVFLVKTPLEKLVAFLDEDSSFRNDPHVQSAAEIRGQGTLEDFTSIVLQPGGDQEAQHYLSAVPGDTLNLSAAEIAAFRALNNVGGAGQPKVEEAVRRTLLGRYQSYRSQGLAGMPPYARSKDKQSKPADDLRRATEAAKNVKKYIPAFYDVLMNYPQGKPAGFKERFFCIRYAMDGRPNFVLRHRFAMPFEDAYVAIDRDFYVSHDYNDTQAVAALLPAADGTLVLYLNRTTTDQLGGFGASAKQAIGESMMAKQIRGIFDKARAGLAGQ